jgi:hypothetical protein
MIEATPWDTHPTMLQMAAQSQGSLYEVTR